MTRLAAAGAAAAATTLRCETPDHLSSIALRRGVRDLGRCASRRPPGPAGTGDPQWQAAAPDPVASFQVAYDPQTRLSTSVLQCQLDAAGGEVEPQSRGRGQELNEHTVLILENNRVATTGDR